MLGVQLPRGLAVPPVPDKKPSAPPDPLTPPHPHMHTPTAHLIQQMQDAAKADRNNGHHRQRPKRAHKHQAPRLLERQQQRDEERLVPDLAEKDEQQGLDKALPVEWHAGSGGGAGRLERCGLGWDVCCKAGTPWLSQPACCSLLAGQPTTAQRSAAQRRT